MCGRIQYASVGYRSLRRNEGENKESKNLIASSGISSSRAVSRGGLGGLQPHPPPPAAFPSQKKKKKKMGRREREKKRKEEGRKGRGRRR